MKLKFENKNTKLSYDDEVKRPSFINNILETKFLNVWLDKNEGTYQFGLSNDFVLFELSFDLWLLEFGLDFLLFDIRYVCQFGKCIDIAFSFFYDRKKVFDITLFIDFENFTLHDVKFNAFLDGNDLNAEIIHGENFVSLTIGYIGKFLKSYLKERSTNE